MRLRSHHRLPPSARRRTSTRPRPSGAPRAEEEVAAEAQALATIARCPRTPLQKTSCEPRRARHHQQRDPPSAHGAAADADENPEVGTIPTRTRQQRKIRAPLSSQQTPSHGRTSSPHEHGHLSRRRRHPLHRHRVLSTKATPVLAQDQGDHSSMRSPLTPSMSSCAYDLLLQAARAEDDRIEESNWLTSTFIDLVFCRLATEYPDVHFLPTDFCHLHLPSITRQRARGRAPGQADYHVRDVLGRAVDYASGSPIVFVANVGLIHWNLFRVQVRPQPELQLFEPMGRLASRNGLSYRSIPRAVIEWLDVCYPEHQGWLSRAVSAITNRQQVSGFDCGVACLLYAEKCGRGQPRQEINETTNQQEISSFRGELRRRLDGFSGKPMETVGSTERFLDRFEA